MSVRERIMLCRMIEKIERNGEDSRRLGLENKSTYRGRPVSRSGSIRTVQQG